MLVIRLNRGGRKHLPVFNIVVTEKSTKRDGKFIEKLGYYQPKLKKDNDNTAIMSLNKEAYIARIKCGAQPSNAVKLIAFKLGYGPKPEHTVKTKKSTSKQKK